MFRRSFVRQVRTMGTGFGASTYGFDSRWAHRLLSRWSSRGGLRPPSSALPTVGGPPCRSIPPHGEPDRRRRLADGGRVAEQLERLGVEGADARLDQPDPLRG